MKMVIHVIITQTQGNPDGKNLMISFHTLAISYLVKSMKVIWYPGRVQLSDSHSD